MSGDETRDSGQWWRGACLYQVYLRSFADSDGDGEGDLAGLLDRLDYLAWLGVEGIWITPFFPSPMHDSGYDVANYRDVDPRFGTLADFDRVVERAHALGMKVVIDQVYSHSSHLHPWFEDSATSRSGPRADWYVWAEPRPDGSPPNNWLAQFGGPSWTWHPARRQYYLHNFLAEQPDLNLQNPEVQDEILDIMRFWFARGVDGMRLDTVNFYMHDRALADNPPAGLAAAPANPTDMQRHVRDRTQPENLPFLERMRGVAGERMLLGEISSEDQLARMVEYTAPGRLQTAYSFALLHEGPDGTAIARAAGETAREGWPGWSLSNHDVVRVATRWGAEGRPGRAVMLQALLISLRGTVILYQGEELGLPHAEVPREALQDPEARRVSAGGSGRDGARTPMAWEDAPGLGFSSAPAWLPADPRHRALSVARQSEDLASILHRCRALVALRRREPALRLGDFETLEADADGLAFLRRHTGRALLCAFNFSDNARPLPDIATAATLAGRAEDGRLPAQGFLIAEIAA